MGPRISGWAPLPEDPYVHILKILCRTLVCIGHVDQARSRRDQALAEARKISPYSLANMLRHVWYVDWAIGGEQSAQALLLLAEEVLAISSEYGFALPLAFGNIARGWCLGVLGEPGEGISLIQQALSKFPTGAKLGAPFHLTVLAELHGKVEQPEEGLKRLAEAANLVEATHERWAEAEMHRLRGTLLLSMHEHAAAENSYRRALEVAQRQNAKFWELRAALDLARLWRDEGKRADARNLLSPIFGWFTEGCDTRDLKDARVLLDELAS